jgi:penicillin-insensitive murein DD-endopeptidase
VPQSVEAGGLILMNQTNDHRVQDNGGKRRLLLAAIACFAAVLCLGLGLSVADAKKQTHKAAQAKAAAKSAKAKTASAAARKGSKRKSGSLAEAKARALAKAKLAARSRKGGLAIAGPPSPPARDYFGKQAAAAPVAARSIGSYARGCLAGGKMLPVNGPAWQAMRLSRNRNWGHPQLVAYVEKLAEDAQKQDKWPGLLVGDMAQPMGGPMTSGHASHQIGLDADIWLKPMPPKTLTPEERESISADSVVAADQVSINPEIWQSGHVQLLKRAASYPSVARIFVHPAIKKALCEAAGTDRGWLSKVRPWWGHNYHFHVRLACPAGTSGCEDQASAGPDDGCGKELESWLKRLKTPIIPKDPPVQKAPMTMAQLPAECAALVGYVPPPPPAPVPMGPPLPERKPDGTSAVTPVSAPPDAQQQAAKPVGKTGVVK